MGLHCKLTKFYCSSWNRLATQEMGDIDPKVYPKITAWLARLNKIPYFKEINEAPAQAYVSLLRSKWTNMGD